jgi:hypothetical protein
MHASMFSGFQEHGERLGAAAGAGTAASLRFVIAAALGPHLGARATKSKLIATATSFWKAMPILSSPTKFCFVFVMYGLYNYRNRRGPYASRQGAFTRTLNCPRLRFYPHSPPSHREGRASTFPNATLPSFTFVKMY